jgi:hypothetical protein
MPQAKFDAKVKTQTPCAESVSSMHYTQKTHVSHLAGNLCVKNMIAETFSISTKENS